MAKCPVCASSGAYVGVVFVECPNISCQHYSQRAWVELIDATLAKMDSSTSSLDEQTTDPDKTPVTGFSIGHVGQLDLQLTSTDDDKDDGS